MSSGLTISYTLTIDLQNERSQGFFGSPTKKTGNFTSTLVLRNKITCVQQEVHILVSYSLDMFSRVNNSANKSNKSYVLNWQFASCDLYSVISNQASSGREATNHFPLQSGLTEYWQVFWRRSVSTAQQATFPLQENGADTPSHISVGLNFQQTESERASVVLNVDGRRHALIQVSAEGHTASSQSQLRWLCAFDKDTAGICSRKKKLTFVSISFSRFVYFFLLWLFLQVIFKCSAEKGDTCKNRCNDSPYFCFTVFSNYVSH